ncbi:MAG: hypothetical protein PUJ82_02255 [Spirochaetales bacterium]|nr:hypothetical protein [Spirochaetales bacterium]MDY5914055.1 hypothetical protein [Treponema sp.]
MLEVYVITVWEDKNGRSYTTSTPIYAHSISEAKAKFKASHSNCKRVTGAYKK